MVLRDCGGPVGPWRSWGSMSLNLSPFLGSAKTSYPSIPAKLGQCSQLEPHVDQRGICPQQGQNCAHCWCPHYGAHQDHLIDPRLISDLCQSSDDCLVVYGHEPALRACQVTSLRDPSQHLSIGHFDLQDPRKSQRPPPGSRTPHMGQKWYYCKFWLNAHFWPKRRWLGPLLGPKTPVAFSGYLRFFGHYVA